MDHPFAQLLVWAVFLGVLWLHVRAVIDVAKSPRSDNAKAAWITLLVGVPVIGLLIHWFFGMQIQWLDGIGDTALPGASPEQREAALKARLNAAAANRRE